MKKEIKNSIISTLYIVCILLFALSVSAANYSIGKYVRDSSNVTLNSGWNMISITLENNDDSGNKSIALTQGWNLIGYSSENGSSQQDLVFVNSSGISKAWSVAVAEGDVNQQLASYVNDGTTKKYRYIPLQESNLSLHRGYWVYAQKAGNLTVQNVGGSLQNESYIVSDLMFSNGTTELNITNAQTAGWIDVSINYWNTGLNQWSLSSLIYPWQGYLIRAFQDNIKLMRQN